MRKFLLLFFLLSFSVSGYSQGGEYQDVYSPDVINPKFNGGGLDKFYEFINQEFDFSKVTKAGNMLVSFTVNVDGAMNNVRILEFNDVESATEMIRVINKAPNWESAKRGCKPFSINMKIPFKFNLKFKPQVSFNTRKIKSNNLPDSTQITKTTEIKKVLNEKQPARGIEKFYKFIASNFQTPLVEGLKGKVVVSFVIDIDGSLTDIKVLKDIGYGTREEAIRVLKICPKWTPGVQNGKPVKCAFTLPINIATSK